MRRLRGAVGALVVAGTPPRRHAGRAGACRPAVVGPGRRVDAGDRADRTPPDLFGGARPVAVGGRAADQRCEPGADRCATGRRPDDTLVVPITDPLPKGTYTVTWRVVSVDDGHVTAGAFAFGVGTPPGAATARAASTTSGPTPLAVASKAALYAGLDAARRDRRRRDRAVPRRTGGAAAARRRARASSPSSGAIGFLVSQQRAIGVPLDTYLRSAAGPHDHLARARNDDRGGLRRDLDAARSLGCRGPPASRRRSRSGSGPTAGTPRRAPHAAARPRRCSGSTCSPAPAGPADCCCWSCCSASAATTLRSPRRGATRTMALERDRDRRGQRHHPGGRRARRLERALATRCRPPTGARSRSRSPSSSR